MAHLNKVMLIGNLGKDPELHTLQSGTSLCRFSLATSRKYRDRDNNQQTETEWHNVVCWGKNAEVAHKYLYKGSPVYVEGRLGTRTYDDRDGNQRKATEITCETVQFLGDGRSTGSEDRDNRRERPPSKSKEQPHTNRNEDDDDASDLPF